MQGKSSHILTSASPYHIPRSEMGKEETELRGQTPIDPLRASPLRNRERC
jgi:hypothetical protein